MKKQRWNVWRLFDKTWKRVTGLVLSGAAVFAVGSQSYGHFAKTAYVKMVEAKSDATYIEFQLFQIGISLDRYRQLCGVDYARCPRPDDTNRVQQLLRDQHRLDRELEDLRQRQRGK